MTDWGFNFNTLVLVHSDALEEGKIGNQLSATVPKHQLSANRSTSPYFVFNRRIQMKDSQDFTNNLQKNNKNSAIWGNLMLVLFHNQTAQGWRLIRTGA